MSDCRENPAKLVSISARVGSISDNNLGGWYSYRASKTALNQLTKCMAVEFARRKQHIATLLLHPGTVDTDLSKPFQKVSPSASALVEGSSMWLPATALLSASISAYRVLKNKPGRQFLWTQPSAHGHWISTYVLTESSFILLLVTTICKELSLAISRATRCKSNNNADIDIINCLPGPSMNQVL